MDRAQFSGHPWRFRNQKGCGIPAARSFLLSLLPYFLRAQTQKGPFLSKRTFFEKLTGRRAYLAGPCGPTTSAAEEFNCRVRDGNGWDLLAMVTRKWMSKQVVARESAPRTP